MLKQKIYSFDGRELNVFSTHYSPQRGNVVLVLPFGVRAAMAERLYRALDKRFNLITWESRFVLDHEADSPDAAIDADMHVRDLEHVIGHCAGGAPVDVIGYCSGAGVALLGAAQYPHAIRRLVLVSGEYMLAAAACPLSGFQRDVDALLPAAGADRASARMMYEKISAIRQVAQSEFHDFISVPFSSPEHLYRFGMNYMSYRKIDFMQTAAAVPQPVLMMVARGDQQVTPASSDIIFRQLPNAVEMQAVDGDHYELCRGNGAMVGHLNRFLGAPC